MRNAEALQTVLEARNILLAIKRKKTNWICHILLKNCLLRHISEGKIERRIKVTGRRGRRLKELLDDLNEEMIL